MHMRFMATLAMAGVVLILMAAPVTAQVMPVDSLWQNQRGSTLHILTFDPPSGQFTGIYINRAPGFHCQGTPYLAVGTQLNNSVGFSVSWNNVYENCNSTTAWAGFVAGNTLTTQWNLATTNTIVDGDDVFRRIAVRENASLIAEE